MFALGAYAEGADNPAGVAADSDGYAEGAADTGLFRVGLGYAAGVSLQIANGDRPVFGDGFASNALADRDGLDDVHELRRQTDLSDEMKQLRLLVESVDGSGLGVELGEGVAEELIEIWLRHNS